MKKKILSEDNIMLDVKCQDKWEAILICGNILMKQGYVSDGYIHDMLEREKIASVYVGNHVAIPHGIADSEKNILHSGISVLQIPQGVDFGSEKAYLMFGIAGKDGTHIDLLSKISLVCMEEDNINRMRKAESKEVILDILSFSKR